MSGEQSLGDRMRVLREERGLLQDELARVARQRGLKKWTRSTVTKIEWGHRDLRASELLVLPYVLGVTFEQLIPTTKFADLGLDFPKMDTRSLRSVVRGRVPGPLPGPHETPGRAEPAEAEEKAARRLGWSKGEVTTRALRLWNFSLTGERERRLIKQLRGRSVSPESQQAIRGRITRQLLVELAGTVKERKR
jgi:transcriptional regulator with XRE-family HTH domain